MSSGLKGAFVSNLKEDGCSCPCSFFYSPGYKRTRRRSEPKGGGGCPRWGGRCPLGRKARATTPCEAGHFWRKADSSGAHLLSEYEHRRHGVIVYCKDAKSLAEQLQRQVSKPVITGHGQELEATIEAHSGCGFFLTDSSCVTVKTDTLVVINIELPDAAVYMERAAAAVKASDIESFVFPGQESGIETIQRAGITLTERFCVAGSMRCECFGCLKARLLKPDGSPIPIKKLSRPHNVLEVRSEAMKLKMLHNFKGHGTVVYCNTPDRVHFVARYLRRSSQRRVSTWYGDPDIPHAAGEFPGFLVTCGDFVHSFLHSVNFELPSDPAKYLVRSSIAMSVTSFVLEGDKELMDATQKLWGVKFHSIDETYSTDRCNCSSCNNQDTFVHEKIAECFHHKQVLDAEDPECKLKALLSLQQTEERFLVFCNSLETAERLWTELSKRCFRQVYFGTDQQSARKMARQLQAGYLVVPTGVNIVGVQVINYELPAKPSEYQRRADCAQCKHLISMVLPSEEAKLEALVGNYKLHVLNSYDQLFGSSKSRSSTDPEEIQSETRV